MTGRQLIAALERECDGDFKILDLPLELDLVFEADYSPGDDVSLDVVDVAFDGPRLLLAWRVQ